MSRNESISLHETSRSADGPEDVEQDASALAHNNSRQIESRRKKACVLAGNAILQLPLWGMLTLMEP